MVTCLRSPPSCKQCSSLSLQEVEKLLLVDFAFVADQLSSDISDDSLKTLVGDPLLVELDKFSVEPIQAVKDLADRKYFSIVP